MNFQERKKKILTAVYETGSLSVFELSEKLAMSPATIRRDLHDIAEEGLLLRTHGGAMKPENPILTSFVEKAGVRDAQKDRISKLASEQVADGDTIFLDCGSTVFRMCTYLKKKNDIRVITNSLPILAELIDIPSISINLIGGELDKSRKAVHGEKAIQHIDSYHVRKAFVGVDGISAENGLTAHGEHESSITSAFIRNAELVFLLTDSSKIGKDSYIKFAALSDITCLITDSEISAENENKLAKNGLKRLIIAIPGV
ncbi:DeoR/GlpR family DNA-binding transcription regulator [Dyadobacter arcticus]|uniref:DeoR family fructose operon transcriptional repressor n=1 Tax=Dyadobacter arcticus TaxID=1078754 RepID=A0ABX0URV2_9BACT|nr:DeoR/GlpR family DNA-binding transcription regulator [Dyadobacter arcticus]NIJ54335.1 DeoR family fructose operon transcriptional repressor [Dyadobacter arcticus]